MSFAPRSAVIRLDADGTPVQFRYPAVTYRVSEDRVTAELGGRHPMAQTSDKRSLRFVMASSERADLQLLNGVTLAYFRCPLVKHR